MFSTWLFTLTRVFSISVPSLLSHGLFLLLLHRPLWWPKVLAVHRVDVSTSSSTDFTTPSTHHPSVFDSAREDYAILHRTRSQRVGGRVSSEPLMTQRHPRTSKTNSTLAKSTALACSHAYKWPIDGGQRLSALGDLASVGAPDRCEWQVLEPQTPP